MSAKKRARDSKENDDGEEEEEIQKPPPKKKARKEQNHNPTDVRAIIGLAKPESSPLTRPLHWRVALYDFSLLPVIIINFLNFSLRYNGEETVLDSNEVQVRGAALLLEYIETKIIHFLTKSPSQKTS